jgi:hypothetical protein
VVVGGRFDQSLKERAPPRPKHGWVHTVMAAPRTRQLQPSVLRKQDQKPVYVCRLVTERELDRGVS